MDTESRSVLSRLFVSLLLIAGGCGMVVGVFLPWTPDSPDAAGGGVPGADGYTYNHTTCLIILVIAVLTLIWEAPNAFKEFEPQGMNERTPLSFRDLVPDGANEFSPSTDAVQGRPGVSYAFSQIIFGWRRKNRITAGVIEFLLAVIVATIAIAEQSNIQKNYPDEKAGTGTVVLIFAAIGVLVGAAANVTTATGILESLRTDE